MALTGVLPDLSWRYWLQVQVARELRKGRKQAGLTQEEVANTLHICQSAVSKYESGKMMPDFVAILSFCYLYGWTLEDFLLRLNIKTRHDWRTEYGLSPAESEWKMPVDLTAIKDFAEQTLAGDASGHDYLHAGQVARLAVSLYEDDHGQLDEQDFAILVAAALLHDTIDDKVVSDVIAQQDKVETLLQQSGIAPIGQAIVAETITHLSYSANLEKHYDLSELGQYVQDADRLEAIGAIGIARTFAYGGQKGHPIYDPAIKPVALQDKAQYRSHQTTTINHFYEKLLKLADQLNTPAGKTEGNRRTAFMEGFLTEFNRETGALSDPAFKVQWGRMNLDKLKTVGLDQLAELQAISRQTFAETFADDNSAADLAEYLDKAYAGEKLTAELADDNSEFLFIEHNQQVAGYLKLNWNEAQTEVQGPDALEVERIYLLADYQRLGLGRQLLEYAFDRAEKLGKTRVWLGVWEHNQKALAFYQKLGFTAFSDHLFQLGEDAQRDILMEKTL